MANTHLFALINIIGGTLVLGSYVACICFYPEYRESFWGGIQGNTRKLFIFSMIPATIGYLLFFYCAIFRPESGIFEYRGLLGHNNINVLCLMFLLASSMWMPALVMYFKTDLIFWWVIVVVVLWITALSLISILFFVISSDTPLSFYKNVSICGLSYIIFHCFILDAVIWVVKLPVK